MVSATRNWAASRRYCSTLKAMKKMVDLLRNCRSPKGDEVM